MYNAAHPYLPTTIFGNRNPVNQPQTLNNQPVEVNKDLFADEDGFQTPPSLQWPPTPKGAARNRRGSRPGSKSTSRGPSQGRPLGYESANVRPELRAAKFQEASRMQDLNTDKQAFFQKTFYSNVDPERPVLQEQGCPSISNPEGLRTFLQPKKK